MTPLPKRRISRSRQAKRRAARRLTACFLTSCPKCGQARLSHQACPVCGAYGPKNESQH